ncbi:MULTISPECIES: ComEC/Rec2 family competence protein [Chryseobacterium]|uniref:ComEC/Rec2 family competence protein n=1 Tax=Chryseobacterium TaxID=59732 RepID=UPI0022752341|nr:MULTISPECIES: MBL fold metallo-hydrolase [Chryseobacterium]MCY1662364.1 MBL fold metallo-hydrolase [Chryseobacterium sp. SL1]WBX98079.1 MBL fold metallo-hydrolase [Chryseobacterium gambrini]
MKIKFLKAGSGDCIVINHNSKNIVIDGGNESTYLISEYYKIKSRNERIDFLIITHHDDDHIKGILDLFKEIKNRNDELLIDNIIFNSPRKILNKIEKTVESNLLSYKQAYDLEQYLIHHGITWETSLNTKDLEAKINEKFYDKNLSFKIFSPSKDILEKYASNKGAYLTSDYRCDWDSSISILMKSLDDKSQDTSHSNVTSIVLSLTYDKDNYLFTGDVTPIRLNEIIDNIRDQNEVAHFKLIKLPHHASYRSLNSEILQKINCTNFLISTNSKKHYLPNKRALLKIISNRKTNESINFYFNYGEVIGNLKISKIDEKKYNLNLISNNKNYGYVFDI